MQQSPEKFSARRSPARLALVTIPVMAALGATAWILSAMLVGTDENATPALSSTSRPALTEPEAGEARRAEGAASPGAVERQDAPDSKGVWVRVVDGAGQPVEGIPVAALDHEKWTLHPLERLRYCTYLRSDYGRRASLTFSASHSSDPIVRSFVRNGGRSQAELEKLLEEPVWDIDGERLALELEHEFLARAMTDEGGEARLPWDRTQHPRLRVGFAFPSRVESSAILESVEGDGPTHVVLELPELEQVSIACAEEERQRWRARISAAWTLKDGSKLWVAWGVPSALSEEGESQVWMWERGLEVRIEAALDAPLASVLLQPSTEFSSEPRQIVLRSSEHYSTLRGTVVAADGSTLAGRKVSLWRSCRSGPEPNASAENRGALHAERHALALDERGSFVVWMPARPRVLRERILMVWAHGKPAAPTTERPYSFRSDGTKRKDGTEREYAVHHQDPALEDLLTYVDLGMPDAAGTQRDLGTLRLGDGPRLLGGIVRWDDGTAVTSGSVVLPKGVTAESDGNREGLHIAEDGSFGRLGIAPRGMFEIEVIPAGDFVATKFQVELGRSDLELRVPRRGALAGRVVLPSWSQIVVCVRTQSGNEYKERTQVNGSFLVPGVPFGTCDVAFRSGGLDLHVVRGVEHATRGTNHPEPLREVDLRPHVTPCVLELRDERGRKKVKVTITLEDAASGFKLEEWVGTDGRLACMLPTSVKHLVAKMAGYRPHAFDVSAAPIVLELVVEKR